MAEFIAAKFSEQEMPETFDPGEVRGLKPQDFVVVPRGDGEDIAYVAAYEYKASVQLNLRRKPYPRVIRRAKPEEVESWWSRKAQERRALVLCKEKARELRLDMKISHARIDEKERKAIFHFTSDQRVDFRHLVKELSALLKTRIELWQVGVRDEARMIDGYGVCGLKTCCSTWLSEFSNISIRMAKEQDISLPPSKLSGQCGRLLCCLSYEVDQYRAMSREALPKGATVKFDGGDWVIIDRNLVAGTYTITNGAGVYKSVKAGEIGEGVRVPDQMKRMGKKVFQARSTEKLESALPPVDSVTPDQLGQIAGEREDSSIPADAGKEAGTPAPDKGKGRGRKRKRSQQGRGRAQGKAPDQQQAAGGPPAAPQGARRRPRRPEGRGDTPDSSAGGPPREGHKGTPPGRRRKKKRK